MVYMTYMVYARYIHGTNIVYHGIYMLWYMMYTLCIHTGLVSWLSHEAKSIGGVLGLACPWSII
jgi:hypothetical protein